MKLYQRIFYTFWVTTGSSFCGQTDGEQTYSTLQWNTSRGQIKTEICALPAYHPLSVHKVSWSNLIYFLSYCNIKCFSILSNTDPTFDLCAQTSHYPLRIYQVSWKWKYLEYFSSYRSIKCSSIFSNGDLIFNLWWKIKCCAQFCNHSKSVY